MLAIIWCSVIESKPGEKVRPGEIWERFPKFVLGYVLTFLVLLFICVQSGTVIPAAKAVTAGGDVFRVIFFVLTFFTIGVVSNFRKLWEEGIVAWRPSIWYVFSVSSYGSGWSSPGSSSMASTLHWLPDRGHPHSLWLLEMT